MPTEILEPNSCDKTTSGWVACGSCSASGESCDCSASSSCDGGANSKSGARFYNFDNPDYQDDWSSVLIKVDWKIYAQEDTCNLCQLIIQYSTNGGSGWNTMLTKNATGSDQTGQATQAISTGQNISNVQVRMYGSATSCDPCSGGPGDVDCGWYEGGKWFCYHETNCSQCADECNPPECA
jgi:hypothetical protein